MSHVGWGKVADGRQGEYKVKQRPHGLAPTPIGVPPSTGKVTDGLQTCAERGFPRLLDPAEGLTDNSRGNCR